MNTPECVIVHCSASSFGDRELIDEWHRERGFASCGYHYVILNGRRRANDSDAHLDGIVQEGRHHDECGAHTIGYNSRSLGICLIGLVDYTPAQRRALHSLLVELCTRYSIDPERVLGHRETPSGARQGKSCPTNLDMDQLRSDLVDALVGGDE